MAGQAFHCSGAGYEAEPVKLAGARKLHELKLIIDSYVFF